MIRLKRDRLLDLIVVMFFLNLILSPLTVTATAIPKPALLQTSETNLEVSLNMTYKETKAGDTFDFYSLVTNNGTVQSLTLIAAINIVNLKSGNPVDPEDWSPERTQYIEPLSTGETANLTWTIHTIWDGDYIVYLVIIPTPNDSQNTSKPISSPIIQLMVKPYVDLNPEGVLPVIIAIPSMLTIAFAFLRWFRRRTIDSNGPS